MEKKELAVTTAKDIFVALLQKGQIPLSLDKDIGKRLVDLGDKFEVLAKRVLKVVSSLKD